MVRRAKALLALAHGDQIKALAAAPDDAFVLDRLGMHLAAIKARVLSVDFLGFHAQAVSFAKLGDTKRAKAMAGSAHMSWTRAQRRRFALALAPWSPAEAARLLEPIHPLAAAAAALAAGDPELARRFMPDRVPASEELQFPAVAAAIASHLGDWAAARTNFDAVLARGRLEPMASRGEGPLRFDTLPAVAAAGPAGELPAVSVLMPVRDLEDHVAAAIASIRAQSLPSWELIVVDDASSDSTRETAESTANGDPRVRILSNPQRLGAFGSRNIALKLARGRYVTVLDGDDFAHPQRLEKHAGALDEGRCGAVASLLLRIDQKGRIVAPRVFPMARRNYSSLMIKTSLARELGGFDDVPVGGDSAMFWRVQAKLGRNGLRRLEQVDTFALQRDLSLTSAADTGIVNREALASRIAYHERIMGDLAEISFPGE